MSISRYTRRHTVELMGAAGYTGREPLHPDLELRLAEHRETVQVPGLQVPGFDFDDGIEHRAAEVRQNAGPFADPCLGQQPAVGLEQVDRLCDSPLKGAEAGAYDHGTWA